MIGILIYIVVVCLVAGFVCWLIAAFAVAQPYAKIAQAVVH